MNRNLYVRLTAVFSLLLIFIDGMGQSNDSDIFRNKEKYDDFIYTNMRYPLIDFINEVEDTLVYEYDYNMHHLKLVGSSRSVTLDMEARRLLSLMLSQSGKYPQEEMQVDFKLADNKVYVASGDLSAQPEFAGGMLKMKEFIDQNLQYPPEACESAIQGSVYCGCIIEKDGSISAVDVIRPIEKYCDAEAVRVIKRMPNWKAGEINGKPVRVYYIIPISFTLK